MAPILAEMQDLPSVLYVEKIEEKDNQYEISRILEGGREILHIPKKALVSCTDSDFFIPRYTSMRGIMMSKRAQIPTWEISDLGLKSENLGKKNSEIKRISMENKKQEKDSFIVKEDEPEAMVEKILEQMKNDGVKLGV